MSPDCAAVAREVGVVENVVVEAVGGEHVAAVVGLVDRPVVAKPLRRQHEHAVVAQFVVLDDGQSLEGFPEADAVGDDAAAEAFQLVDGPDDAVPLELEEFFPDDAVANARRRLDDSFLVQLVAEVFEQVIERQVIDERRLPMLGQGLQLGKERRLGFGLRAKAGPQASNQEARSEHSSAFSADWMRLNCWLGVSPRPLVVNELVPVMTRFGKPSSARTTIADCGMVLLACLTSTFLAIQSAHCFASQRTCSRLRNALSESPPNSSPVVLFWRRQSQSG